MKTKNAVLALFITLFANAVAAQMPMPLLDPTAPKAAMARTPIPNWQKIAPLLKEAIECRRTVAATPALRALLPSADGTSTQISAPVGFTAFDLPVQIITITKNSTTAMVAGHPETVKDKIAASSPAKPTGKLSVVENLPFISDIVCHTGSR